MTDHPILFSAPMVRALLAGTKTQTRRVVKGAALDWLSGPSGFNAEFVALPENGLCPYGKPGDRLWVREAWTTHAFLDSTSPRDLKTRSIHYQADGQIKTGKTRPSIHMPRWASRITLEITGVRVERLQDISEADAMAEGVQCDSTIDHRSARTEDGKLLHSHAVDQYRALWESINGPGSWEANPWVWVVEFKVVAQ